MPVEMFDGMLGGMLDEMLNEMHVLMGLFWFLKSRACDFFDQSEAGLAFLAFNEFLAPQSNLPM